LLGTELFASSRLPTEPIAREACQPSFLVVGNPYAVTFDRSLANCVVSATPSRGDPDGGGAFHHAIPSISMAGDSVTLSWENDQGTLEDTSFMIAAFC
jgi:hypothetical protein